jgi:hypothetical protein
MTGWRLLRRVAHKSAHRHVSALRGGRTVTRKVDGESFWCYAVIEAHDGLRHHQTWDADLACQ